MLEQSLNLLPPRFRKVHTPFNANMVLVVVGITLLCSGLVSLGVFGLSYQLNQEFAAAEVENKNLKSEIDDFKANNSKKILDQTIAIRIKKYEEMLRQRQTFLKKINSEDFGNTKGFSEYLLALARKKVPNIWIEELSIQGDAQAFGIRGKAVQPTDITLFLQSLQDEPAMSGITFEDLNLSRQTHPKGDFVSFSISYGEFSGGVGLQSGMSKTLANLNLPNVSGR